MRTSARARILSWSCGLPTSITSFPVLNGSYPTCTGRPMTDDLLILNDGSWPNCASCVRLGSVRSASQPVVAATLTPILGETEAGFALADPSRRGVPTFGIRIVVTNGRDLVGPGDGRKQDEVTIRIGHRCHGVQRHACRPAHIGRCRRQRMKRQIAIPFDIPLETGA